MRVRNLMAAALLFSSAAQSAPQVAPTQPTGKWVVNFADAQCFLSRDYGSPENPRTLIMQPSAMGHSMRLVVVHKGPKNADYVTRPGKIVFEPGGRTIAKTITSYPLHGSDFVRHNTGLAGDDFTQLVSSASVSIMAGNKLHQSFALPQFSEALKVLEECRLDLLDGWGFSRQLAARFKSGDRKSVV